MEEIKKAYEETLEVLFKNKELLNFDVDDLEKKSKLHLFGLELKEVHGLNVYPKSIYDLQCYSVNDFMFIGMYGSKYNRTISYPVDGRQPEDELLLQICFSTGAYIFGEDYPTDLFKEFWLELKSFQPDYVDEANHGLYWKINRAKDVFNRFSEILKGYRQLYQVQAKDRKKELLKKQLAELEGQP